jgi:hypothetical protein
MSNKKKRGGKDKRVHAPTWGTSRPLCGAKSAKVSREPTAINCEACGRVAVKLVNRRVEAEALEKAPSPDRQESGLAALQQPRWWETNQVDVSARAKAAERDLDARTDAAQGTGFPAPKRRGSDG